MIFLTDLPADIVINTILPKLDVKSLMRLSSTCRRLHRQCMDEFLWKHLVIGDFNLPKDAQFRQKGWQELYKSLNNPVAYTWGENFDGRLGHTSHRHGIRPFQYSTPCELVTLRDKGIVDIVAGGWSFHALDQQGHVWMWGTLQENASMRFSLGAKSVPVPEKVNLPPNIYITSISCGRTHAIALSDQGEVWHWSNCWKPQRVQFPSSVRIVQVSANWGFSSVLSDKGEIYIVPEPTRVPHIDVDLQDTNIPAFAHMEPEDAFVQIAGLENYTIVLTRRGRILKVHTKDSESLIASPAQEAVELIYYSAKGNEINDRHYEMKRFVTASFLHFAVYTSEGEVMLGSQDDPYDKEPEIKSGLTDICKVSFGDYHCGAITTDGRLFTWGAYSSGALGHGNDNTESSLDTPKLVDTLSDMFVFAIGFGGWHSGVLAIPRTHT